MNSLRALKSSINALNSCIHSTNIEFLPYAVQDKTFFTSRKRGRSYKCHKRNILMKFQRVGGIREEFMESIMFLAEPWRRIDRL